MSDTLEGRIAAMLSAADAGSDAVAALIQEAETAAQQADADAAKARADALDPAVVIDVAQMSAKVTAAELTRDRMRAALPKLRERLDDALRREYAAAWLEDYERVEAEVAALAADLTNAYTECVARLIDTLGRIPALDAQVARVNNRAPPGVKDRLQLVEQTARCVDSFGPNGLLSLRTELKLPKFTFTDGARYQFSWPLPQPSLAAQMASMPVPRGIAGPDWHLMIDERDRQRREESERLSAFYEKREREGERSGAKLSFARPAGRIGGVWILTLLT
jgi:hypothetical protein